MSKTNVQQVYEGQWTDFERHDRLQCCDCCLVHSFEWRIRNSRLQIKMLRENRSTAAYRRAQGIKVACKKDGDHRNTRKRSGR